MREKASGAAWLAGGLAIALASGSSAYAQAVRTLPVDTAGQSLATALTDLARRSGRELLLAAPTIAGRAAPRLKGRYTIDQALPLLLAGSGTAYRRTGDGTYIVYVAPTLPSPEPDVPVALPELLVTGRSQNRDIQRTENDIQAYKVWSSRDIEQSHSADIDEFLRRMATGDAQVASAVQDPSGTAASNRSEVDLRGLGSNQTLVLVDGRRMPALPSGGGVYVLQSDVNGLPLSAVDRIEVLNSTAGGVYGSGATAGAINIVLKRDYRGADLSTTYGITDRGDAPTRRLDGRIGFSPDEGRTDVMIAFGLIRAGALADGDRDYDARARAQRYASNPAVLLGEVPVSSSVNIVSLSHAPLTLDPAYGGASLGSALTFAPIAYGGAASDGGALLRTNAGRLDTSLSPDVGGARRALLSQRDVSSLIASVRRQFGPSIQVYGDLLVLRNDGQAVIPGGVAQKVIIRADAPTNPFQQDILVSFPTPGLDPVARNRSQTTRGSVGVIAELWRGWKLNADYSAGGAHIDVSVQALTPQAGFFNALASGQGLDGGAPLNLLGGYPAVLAAMASHRIDGGYGFTEADHFRDRSLRLAGPLLDLGGGPLTLTLAAEDRRDDVPASVIHAPGLFISGDIPLLALSQSARLYYAELRAPLTDRYAGPAGLRGLELQLAVQHERDWERVPANLLLTDQLNSASVAAAQSTTVYTAGFKVYPLDGLMLRASIASGFLPPRTDQIGSRTDSFTSDPATYASDPARYQLEAAEFSPQDPRRGGERLGIASGYNVVGGGSTRLAPERARSLSAGLVLTPPHLSRLRVSIDYTRIEKRQEIADFHAYDAGYFVQHEDQFPGRVTRAPLTDADRAKGYTAGVVTAVDTTSFNIGRTLVEAVDLQGDYLIPTERLGDFRLRVATTWQPRLRRQTDPESPAVNFVGYADGPLAWRANGGMDWAKGATSLGFNVVFYDGYRVFARQDDPATILMKTQQQGSDRIPPQAYVDLFATRRIALGGAVGGLREIQVRLGVQNLFDHSPPLVAEAVTVPGTFNYSTYGDPRRRRFEITLAARF